MSEIRSNGSEYARFNCWDEIFESVEERERHWRDFVKRLVDEYESSGPLESRDEGIDPDTGLRSVTLNPKGLGIVMVEELPSGDLKQTFINEEGKFEQLIRPEVGSRAHEWTYDTVLDLYQRVREKYEHEFSAQGRHELAAMLGVVRGKPASIGWENRILFGHERPLRIGFCIYAKEGLEKAMEMMGEEK